MNNEPVILTTIRTQGVAIADFDLANFTVVIRETGETKEIVKKALAERVDNLDAVMAALETSGVSVDKDRLTQNTSIVSDYKEVKKKWVPNGYVATFTLRFQTSSVEEVAVIYDKLSAIEKAEVYPPEFKIKDLTTLHDAGRKDAFDKAMDLFRRECATVGFNPDNYKVHNFTFQYSDRHSGGARPMARAVAASYSASPMMMESAGGGPDPVNIEAGKAEVYVSVQMSFVEKESRASVGRVPC